ncbi:transcriptional regulator with XRE-family HTH domain [Deinobacterium chartae]|uniref:Transcriptional regulator with XRE-family HTH domain n=1 Tax=Deinobacterium chartae TaxID=521158 RepID=A0A841I0Z3_9DEIO|nr:helix-turn-helix transcriptional regulator [Deinobacterium chartae]MBB6098079.1 transcriptional regulator with XRE-family HTH domain [Deinobacterium chartae]
MTSNLPVFGARVREWRAAHKWSLRQLAQKVQSSPAHLCMIENDQVRPSLDLLSRLAAAFGLSLEALLVFLSEDARIRESLDACARTFGDRYARLRDPSWQALLLHTRRLTAVEPSEQGWLRLHQTFEKVLSQPALASD